VAVRPVTLRNVCYICFERTAVIARVAKSLRAVWRPFQGDGAAPFGRRARPNVPLNLLSAFSISSLTLGGLGGECDGTSVTVVPEQQSNCKVPANGIDLVD
jgi:hypothetical protein